MTFRSFAIPLIAIALTNSESVSGILVSVEAVLVLVLSPIGGAFIDRHSRRKIMILLGMLGMLFAGIASLLMLANRFTLIILTVLMVFFGLLQGLLGGSNDAILKSLIPTESFARAQAVREGRESFVGMAGDAVSGLLYRVAAYMPFMASGILYGVEMVTAIFLPDDTARLTARERRPSFLQHFIEGWRWAITKKKFMQITLVGSLVNIALTALTVGAPIMLAARRTDPVLIGLLGTGSGIAGFLGSLIAAKILQRIATGRLLTFTFSFIGLCFVPMMFSDGYVVILCCTTAVGLLLPSLNSGLVGFVFGKVPEDMQGRASSVFETLLGAFSAVTPAATGFILKINHGFMLLSACAFLLVLTATCITCFASIRNIPTPNLWNSTDL